MKKLFRKLILCIILCLLATSSIVAQQTQVTFVTASVNEATARNVSDNDNASSWNLSSKDLLSEQWIMLTLDKPGDVKEMILQIKGTNKEQLNNMFDFFITYDPKNLGNAVKYQITDEGADRFKFNLTPQYGAHIKVSIKNKNKLKQLSISDLKVYLVEKKVDISEIPLKDRLYMDSKQLIEIRVENLLSAMTIKDKMELLREGWGIPGVPHLGIPALKKVEAVHGFSYGSALLFFLMAYRREPHGIES